MTDYETDRVFAREVTDRWLEAVEYIIADRTSGKVTQSDIARATGINSTNISRLKSDPDRSVTLEAVCRLSSFYKISAYWLINGQGNMHSNDAVTDALSKIMRPAKLEAAFTEIEHSISVLRSKLIKT